jgi:hypothetical protein
MKKYNLTSKEIEEGRILIAAYMNYTLTDFGTFVISKEPTLTYSKAWFPESDWNDLMPIVNIIDTSSIYDVQVAYDNREDYKGWEASIFTLFPRDEILTYLEDYRFEDRIKATFVTVVAYIKYINQLT